MQEFDGKGSSQVHWARYDPLTRTLEIDFKNSKGGKASTYSYAEFSKEDWIAFQSAEQKGSHFARAIRNNFKAVKK